MKRTLSSFFVFILLATGLVSCGGKSTTRTNSGLTYRIFVSNPLNPTPLGTIFPGLNIVDATKDVLSAFDVDLSGTTTNAGMMVESPKRDRTVVFSPTSDVTQSNTLAMVDNAKETASGSVTLPGPTESMFVWSDNTTLFAAVPRAAVTGQPAGAVLQIDIVKNSISATIPIPGAHFLVPNANGSAILAISDTANAVTVIAPSLISTGNPLTPVSTSPGLTFDRPVWAVFSPDGSTAYVMNCGAQCGGTAASIAVVNMAATPPAVTSVVPVAGATYGILSGGNLYVAGTPDSSGTDCQANLCGVLTIFPGADLTAVPATLAITDGYHNHMVLAPHGQLFIGSRICTDVLATSSTPARGCLSVVNTAVNTVYTAPQNGDVTGIKPIDGRSVVYVCENGALQIYDTELDLGSGHQLQVQPTRSDGTGQVTITGQAIDVVVADFPNGAVIPN
ncbi:MAG TPA: hypothetical protein VJO35_10440 [Terriglobales bacterium]|nr:hypothetical protein [Terriglobales bacterium]